MPPWERYQQQQPEQSERATPWRRYAARQQASPQAAPQPESEPPQPQPQRPATPGQQVEGGLAAFNRGLFLGGDPAAAIAGLMSGGAEMVRQGGVRDVAGIGRAARGGYEQQHERTNQAYEGLRAQRPGVAGLAEGTGAAAPILAATLATGGAATPEMIAAQGARGIEQNIIRQGTRLPTHGAGFGPWAAQTAQGAATGAGYTGAYAFNSTDGSLTDRWRAANEAAPLGAVVGAAVPTGINAVQGLGNLARPAWQALANPSMVATQAAESGAGVFGSQAASGAGRGGRPRPRLRQRGPNVPESVVGRLNVLRDRSGQSVDQLTQRVAGERANPEGRVVADLFDDPGTRTMRPIVQGPGRTGQAAARTVEQRLLRAPERIDEVLRRELNVGETRHQALQRLEGEYRDVAANAYGPMFRQPMSAEARAVYNERLAPMLSPDYPNAEVRRIMQDALGAARRQFDLDLQVGRVQGTFDENLPRMLHYVKMELGNLAEFEAHPLRGSSGNRVGTLRQIYRQFADALDPGGEVQAIIPGYRQVSAQAGDFFTAHRAIQTGDELLTLGPEEVRATMAAATPFERYHIRVAVADKIRAATQGTVDGSRNAVTVQLRRPRVQAALREAFENPEQAANFIGTLNTQSELARSALQWGSGSQTYSNAMHGMDEGVAAAAEMAGHAATANPAGVFGTMVRVGKNAATLGALERRNNVVGGAMLRPVAGDAEDRAFVDEVLRIMREREAGGAGRAARRSAAAAVGANQTQRNRRQ